METVLYSFTGDFDGAEPSSLIADSAGNLYGTTVYGGNTQIDVCDGNEGCGAVFELSPNSNGSWTETTLYKFCPQRDNCTDGHRPVGGLVRDGSGNLYGTTIFGGVGLAGCDPYGGGCGVAFKVDTAGHETVLHTFTGGSDGACPWAVMVMDSAGNFYGSAQHGGDLNCSFNGNPGCGVVFKITP